MKVLIFDNNHEITEVISRYLNSKGIDNNITGDPIEGLKKIKEEKYDTVLLDISMPEFIGIDMIYTLEREKKLQSQKVVAYSSDTFSENEIHHLLSKEGVQVCIKESPPVENLLTSIAC